MIKYLFSEFTVQILKLRFHCIYEVPKEVIQMSNKIFTQIVYLFLNFAQETLILMKDIYHLNMLLILNENCFMS